MIKKPSYLLECIITPLLGIEDYFIKPWLLKSHVKLPITENLQNFYYNHSGDYVDGFGIAFVTDMALTFGNERLYNLFQGKYPHNNLIKKAIENLYKNYRLVNILSGLTSSGIIILEEINGYFSNADVKDIPMGVAGALTHVALRYLAIKDYEKKNK